MYLVCEGSMRYIRITVLAFVIGCSAVIPASAAQGAPDDRGAAWYAELNEVLRLLQKSAELNPRDPIVYYYMFQTYQLQYAYTLRRLTALVELGQGDSPAAQALRTELDRLSDEMHRTMQRLCDLGVPIDCREWPGGPIDAPPHPRKNSSDHPG